jgi:phage host-nuclease inhibitor protein Gam
VSKKKTKTKAMSAPAAQSRDEAQRMVAEIGEISRELARQEADLGDALAKVKADAEAKALPLKTRQIDLHEAVQKWAEANRAELTRDGRTKTVELTTGKVSWRNRPDSVGLRGVEAIIEHLKTKLEGRFLRTKYEVDKDAMLGAKDDARKVPGVTIKSAGEEFIVEPFDALLAEVA